MKCRVAAGTVVAAPVAMGFSVHHNATVMGSSTSPTPQSALPALRDVLPRPMDWKVVTILLMTCVVLTGCKYFGSVRSTGDALGAVLSFLKIDEPARRLAEVDRAEGPPPGRLKLRVLRSLAALQKRLRFIFEEHPRRQLWQHHYWVAIHVLAYAVVPAVLIRCIWKERLSDYGLKLTGWHRLWWVYGAGLGVVLPLVLLFGRTSRFQQTYPFYKQAGNSGFDFLAWELAYGIQFLALEFFFRGVLVHGLKHRLGWYAVPIMTVPYCMIHFGKPLPETLGAILAGLFLGTLSLWTRSIWLGTALHVSVAVSMDVTALYFKNQLLGLLNQT